MEENKPLDEQEQKQLIEIMQIFMQLPNRANLELRLFADASGSIYKDDKLDEHFHNLEEGVRMLRWYANPEQDETEDSLFLAPDTTLE